MTILAAALLVSPLTPGVQAKEVSVEFFYDSLDPYGEWIQTADYGFVWHPKEVSEDWRPYTDGSWAYTDAGWTWLSEEPYGAIVYHYGRWTRLQDTGWVWVPDTEWAPAWVSWRKSEQYVGWAPLPPEATFKRDAGIGEWADSYYDIGPAQYSFVAVRDFGAPRLAKVVLPRRQNVQVITETRNITNITYTSGVIYNDGPQYTVISRESREPVRRLRLERRDDVVFEGHRVRDEGLRATIAGDALRIFAPAVSFRSEVKPQRVTRRVERVEVDRGWRDVPQAQELRARIQQDTPRAPANLPKQPTFTRATAALGLSDNAERKRNLDQDGRPRVDREGRSTGATATTDQPRTPANAATTESARPGDRPRSAPESTPAPTGRKSATSEVKPGQGRPQPGATEPAPGAPRTARDGTEPGAPGAPRSGKGGGPNATAPGREPSPTTRPEGAPDSREGKPGAKREGADAGAPDAPRSGKGGGPNATAPGRDGAKPSATTRPEGAPEPREGKPDAARGNKDPRPDSARPETARPDAERGGKKESKVSTPSGAADAPPSRKEGAPQTARPEGARPDAERNGGREPKASAPGAEAGRPHKDGGRPDADRPGADRPSAERSGAKEPKVSTSGGEATRPRKEGGAPEAARRPEGNPSRESAAPAGRPGAPAGSPAAETKGKKGDKDKDKDKDKAQ